ncbi:MAG: four helix bundle protein [Verrucomicrobiales bacterium]|nr:four helix bundle protein [Verrucomicrobiales bacterium]
MDVEDLEIYQEAMRIGEEIWGQVSRWDFFAKDTVGKQLVRCTDSIAANISEGYGRYHYAENRKFCFYARGSLEETITFIKKSASRDLIPAELAQELETKLITLRKRLNAYIRTLGPAPRDQ